MIGGDKYYIPDVPCKRGHMLRYVKSGGCVECALSSALKRRTDKPNYIWLQQKQWRDQNRDQLRVKAKERYKNNRLTILAAEKLRRSTDPEFRAKKNASTMRWAGNNKDYIIEFRAAYYAKNREKILEYQRNYSKENSAQIIARVNKWVRENPEDVRATKRRWASAHPQECQTNVRNRRARKRAAEGHHTAADVRRIFSAQKGRCAICRREEKLTVDHIQPLDGGGSNWPRNLQGLCGTCNSSKGARDPIAHMQKMGMLL